MIDWLVAYRKEWLRPDLVAGLTAAAVVIPKSMAYATVAGLPIEVGLYTAFVPIVIYAVLGSSRVLSVSTTTTIAILVAADLAEVSPGADPAELLRAAATLSLLVGAMLERLCGAERREQRRVGTRHALCGAADQHQDRAGRGDGECRAHVERPRDSGSPVHRAPPPAPSAAK